MAWSQVRAEFIRVTLLLLVLTFLARRADICLILPTFGERTGLSGLAMALPSFKT
jgi:hypothetical protein